MNAGFAIHRSSVEWMRARVSFAAVWDGLGMDDRVRYGTAGRGGLFGGSLSFMGYACGFLSMGSVDFVSPL